MRANQSAGREPRCDGGRAGASSLASCASGPSGCMDGAVDVIRDNFRSLPESDVDGGSEERLPVVEDGNGDGLRVRSKR